MISIMMTQQPAVDYGILYAVYAPSANRCWVGGVKNFSGIGPSYVRKWTPGGWVTYDPNWPNPSVLPPWSVYAVNDDTDIYWGRYTGNRIYQSDGSVFNIVLSSSSPEPMAVFGPTPGTAEMYVGWYYSRVIGVWSTTDGTSWTLHSITNPYTLSNIQLQGMWGTSFSDLRVSCTQADATNVGMIALASSGTLASAEWRGYIGSVGGQLWNSFALVIDPPYDSAPGYWHRVFQRSGSSWSAMSVQPRPSGEAGRYDSIGGVSTSDFWVGGTVGSAYYFSPTKLWHWTGASWTEYSISAGGSITRIHARTSTDVWAVGAKQVGSSFYPMVIHWDGSSWTDRSFTPT